MKRLVLVILLTCGQLGLCQKDSQDPYAEKLVTSFVTPSGTPIIYSMQEKAVNRLGDRAAIGLIRHMSAQAPATPQEVVRIISVIRMAYAAPEVISSDADREPKATLLLLSYLSLLPASGISKAEIDNTRSYVVRQITDYRAKQAGMQH